MSRLARVIARQTVGAATLSTRAEIDQSVESAFRFLSQQEELAVVIRPEPPPSQRVERDDPSYGRILASFKAYWEAEALRRHFIWAPAPARDPRHWLRDGVHRTEDGHRERAAVLLPAFVEAVRVLRAESS